MMDQEPQWFYCVKHHTVEGALGCKAKDRLGPYNTKDEAAHAMDTVRERNQQWSSSDPE